jgi:hypothetical protein
MLSSKLVASKRLTSMLFTKRFSRKVDKSKIGSTPNSSTPNSSTPNGTTPIEASPTCSTCTWAFAIGLLGGALGVTYCDSQELQTQKALNRAERSDLELMSQRYSQASRELVDAKTHTLETEYRRSVAQGRVEYLEGYLDQVQKENDLNKKLLRGLKSSIDVGLGLEHDMDKQA